MTKQEKAALKLVGKTILLDQWTNHGTSFSKTFRVDLVGKVARDLIHDVWSWPEKKEHFCLIGEHTWIKNGEVIEKVTKAIVYNKDLDYSRLFVD